MKKPNNILTITIFCLSIFFIIGCDAGGGPCKEKDYQLKNTTGRDVLLKIYGSSYHPTTPTVYLDTLYLESNAASREYYVGECPPISEYYFLDPADSLDIIHNDTVLIRYINTEFFTSKSPFDTENSYERVEKSDGTVVYVYTILNEDFE